MENERRFSGIILVLALFLRKFNFNSLRILNLKPILLNPDREISRNFVR